MHLVQTAADAARAAIPLSSGEKWNGRPEPEKPCQEFSGVVTCPVRSRRRENMANRPGGSNPEKPCQEFSGVVTCSVGNPAEVRQVPEVEEADRRQESTRGRRRFAPRSSTHPVVLLFASMSLSMIRIAVLEAACQKKRRRRLTVR